MNGPYLRGRAAASRRGHRPSASCAQGSIPKRTKLGPGPGHAGFSHDTQTPTHSNSYTRTHTNKYSRFSFRLVCSFVWRARAGAMCGGGVWPPRSFIHSCCNGDLYQGAHQSRLYYGCIGAFFALVRHALTRVAFYLFSSGF